MTARNDSGSSRSPSAVDPVTSQKTIVTILRTEAVDDAFEQMGDHWSSLLDRLRVASPDEHVDRMVNVFPSDKQSHVRTMLSTSLRGVVSQQLLQKFDKNGRVAALEILVNTSASANLIRQGKLDQLENVMQSGGQFGMRTMDTAIQQLLDSRQVTGKEAYKKGISKSKFEPFKDQG